MNNAHRFAILSIALIGALSGCSSKMETNPSRLTFENFCAEQMAAGLALTPTSTCDKTCTDRKMEFRYVVYAGKEVYCYWDEKRAETQTDFDALAIAIEARIVNSLSSSEYYLLLREWASSFHDGHVNVMLKNDPNFIEVYTAPIRFEVMAPATSREKIIISEVKDRSTGLSVGDEVLTVNGVPALDALTQATNLSSSGSTERMRRYWAGRRLVDVIGTRSGSQTFELTVQPAAGGATRTVQLYRAVEINAKPDPTRISPEFTGAEITTARVLPNSVGYLRIDGFSGTQQEFLLSQAMDKLASTRGLIIDLRKNGGGALYGDRIIERLINKPVIRYRRSERVSDYVISQRPEVFGLARDLTGLFALWHDLEVTPTPKHYGNPVVALISPYCFSACDTFTTSLRDNGLATFVGEPTGGGTGTPLVFSLPISDLQFRYSTIRGQGPAGLAIEGSSTMPDVEIEPTVQDRSRGEDSQLVKAIEVLEQKIGTGTPVPSLASAVAGLTHYWEQGFDRSPTASEDETLRLISARDGRD